MDAVGPVGEDGVNGTVRAVAKWDNVDPAGMHLVQHEASTIVLGSLSRRHRREELVSRVGTPRADPAMGSPP